MKHLEIRKRFKNFFTDHNNHQWLRSSPLIPHQDPSLLFVNAGMNQFKNTFLGTQLPPSKNVMTIQKCVRAGGKHNDLEQVGFSFFHHTFFEMMGNFSFGGYFKEDACYLAWTFLTKELGLPEENLAVSVFKEDQETAVIWNQKIGVSEERIFFLGEEDNFWRMGKTGPCGPCTEIYFEPEGFRGKKTNMFEIWNLVFMQYHEDQNQKQIPLQLKCIDTGMGLERLACLLQGEQSNFHTDLFRPILDEISKKTNCSYHYISSLKENQEKQIAQSNFAFRVLADHIRAGVFLMSDGVYPSNEGRGYVLRRILRRAIYYSKQLSEDQKLLSSLVNSVIQTYQFVYPELKTQQRTIELFFTQEEEKFLNTLDQGRHLLEKEIQKLKKSSSTFLDTKKAFRLYDTYGFPIDLTHLICKKENISVDRNQFQSMMKESKLKNQHRSHFVTKKKTYPSVCSDIKATQFVGYEQLESHSKLVALFDSQHRSVLSLQSPANAFAIFDSTCVYAEGGGQVADQAVLLGTNLKGSVKDCKNIEDHYIHSIQLKEGSLQVHQTYQLKVNAEKRKQIAIHHSATHLLHSALRQVLGTHTKQSGSLVNSEKLRFDFTSPIALTENQCIQIEELVNQQIHQSISVKIFYKDYDQAIQDGALSFFDKPEVHQVRVLKMGDFSHELCGGTHVNNTSEIRLFKILNESAVASGIRRIEAVCGATAVQWVNQLARENMKARRWLNLSIASPDLLLVEIKKQKDQIRLLKKSKPTVTEIPNIKADHWLIENQKLSVVFLAHTSNEHRVMGDIATQIRKQLKPDVILLVGDLKPKSIVVSLSVSISQKIKAQQIIHALKGKGGGPVSFAKGSLINDLSMEEIKMNVLSFLKTKWKELNSSDQSVD